MRSILNFSIFFLLASVCFAQEITNITFEPQQDKIIIYYDLTGDKDEEYEVSVVLRREEYAAFQLVAKSVTGDVGLGKFAGTKRKVIWDVAKDYHIDPEVTDYYFEVKVKTISGGISWYYYVIAAVLGGATAAVLVGGGDEEQPPVTQNPIGAPPVRP
jgi:hypothetical protein